MSETSDWWPEDAVKELRQGWDDGLSLREIGLRLNRSRMSVHKKAQKLNLPPRKPTYGPTPEYSPEQIDMIRRLYATTAPNEAIINAVNRIGPKQFTLQQLRNMVKRMHLRRSAGWHSEQGRIVATKRWVDHVPKSKQPKPQAIIRVPQVIPLREVYRLAADLGVPRSKRDSIEALNKAMRREQPDHPGFILGDRQPSRLRWYT